MKTILSSALDAAVEDLRHESEGIEEDFIGQRNEYFREKIIELAVQAADQLLLEASDGSTEETNYLTAKIAQKLIEKALNPFGADMLKRDLGMQANPEQLKAKVTRR